MANASDKARFHLEQTVSELREWERRKIFTKPELTSINTQRTHHETLLASRESTPTTTLAYFTHERNVTSLLSARLSRLPHSSLPSKVRTKLHRLRSRHLFSLLERGTRRHHGDLGLWSQYLAFCEEKGAGKRQAKIVSEVARLFPTRGQVWEMAAGWAEGRGDIEAARGFWMRGVRFCARDWGIRLGWARMEMRWVIRARKTLSSQQKQSSKIVDAAQIEDEEKDADVIALPRLDDSRLAHDEAAVAHDIEGRSDGTSSFSSTPALTGAIPKAIFDSAMKDSRHNRIVAQDFLDMFMEFSSLPCTSQIVQHVIDALGNESSMGVMLRSARCRSCLLGVAPDRPEFATALRTVLVEVKASLASFDALEDKRKLAETLLSWMHPLARDESLVPELKQVVGASVKRLEKLQLDARRIQDLEVGQAT